jgi:hypothetical protein
LFIGKILRILPWLKQRQVVNAADSVVRFAIRRSWYQPIGGLVL